MPRVSVILPNYNYARYLKERVRSILNQTMTDFELIYVDDASRDASNQIMEPFAQDPRVRQVLHTENSGRVYQRWHEGALLATGDWLWFAGADDTAHPRFLERLLALSETYPSAALLHCNRAMIDADGRYATTRLTHYGGEVGRHLDRDYFSAGYEEAARLVEINFIGTASALLLRRDAYMEQGGWDSRLWLCADWDLYLSILRHHDVAYLTDPLASYRIHAKTVTKTTKYVTMRLEDAYCAARAYNWMRDDPRCTPEMRATVHGALRAKVLEIFAEPNTTIPDNLRFAAEEVYKLSRIENC